ncbi:MAG TPA: hypothetical protein VHB46_09230 [Burkholderiales bacterium]|nr:hypothetical protein [Burkholderiales bacterium]
MLQLASASVLAATATPLASSAERGMEAYQDLKPIASFGSVVASVHKPSSDNAGDAALPSSNDLTRYLREQVAKAFPDVPINGNASSGSTDADGSGSVGRLSCRVWIDSGSVPVVFQVKCQVSTASHLNIIEDTSLGYGPKEKASEVVRGQIDHIIEGFAQTFAKVKMP